MELRITNRWIVLLGALSARFAIGALYAWSLFNKPISVAWGMPLREGGYSSAVAMTYAISLVSFALATMLSSQVSTPSMLYVTYGVMAGGAILFKEVISRLLGAGPYTPELISSTFLTLGIIYAVMTFLGASLLTVPSGAAAGGKTITSDAKDYRTREMLKTVNFYKLVFSDLLALMPGLLVIGLAANIGKGPAGLSIE